MFPHTRYLFVGAGEDTVPRFFGPEAMLSQLGFGTPYFVVWIGLDVAPQIPFKYGSLGHFWTCSEEGPC